MEPWVHKYNPKKIADVIGQSGPAEAILKYLKGFKKGAKPLLITGKPGVGKTCLVHAIGNELDREILEINASDTRNKASVEALLGPALHQQSLFFKGKIILVDEIDGLSGTKDRGGAVTVLKLIEKSSHPVIMVANDPDSDKLKAIRKKSIIVDMEAPTTEEISDYLHDILKREKIKSTPEAVTAVARRSGGDIRAALNDMQSLITGDEVSKEDVDLLSDREHKEEVIQALLRVFKTTKAEMALPAFDLVDLQPNEILLWIEENLPREYKKPEDIARALDALAEADRYLGRIRRWQYYRFYVYAYNLLSAGVALAKDEKYPGTHKYKRSERPLKIWIYNQKNAKRKKLAEELSPQLHTSKTRIQQDVLPYLRHIWKVDRKQGELIAETYELSEEDCTWFDK